MVALDHRDIVLALQVEPELRPIAEIAAKADGSIGADGASAVHNIGDTTCAMTAMASASLSETPRLAL